MVYFSSCIYWDTLQPKAEDTEWFADLASGQTCDHSNIKSWIFNIKFYSPQSKAKQLAYFKVSISLFLFLFFPNNLAHIFLIVVTQFSPDWDFLP